MNTLWLRINAALLTMVLLVGLAIVGLLATRAYGGPLDPSGTPAPSLPQVEPRIPISALPFTISQPGSYFVTKSLTIVGGQNGITVNASEVTIDLNGFSLDGANTGGAGIYVPSLQRNVVVRNGSVLRWIDGVSLAQAVYSRIDGITARGNTGSGILIGAHGEINDCQAHGNVDGVSVYFSVVRGCTVGDNTRYGIVMEGNALASNNRARNNATGIRVQGNYGTVSGNELTENTLDLDVPVGTLGTVIRDNVLSRQCSNSYHFLGTDMDIGPSAYHQPGCGAGLGQ